MKGAFRQVPPSEPAAAGLNYMARPYDLQIKVRAALKPECRPVSHM